MDGTEFSITDEGMAEEEKKYEKIGLLDFILINFMSCQGFSLHSRDIIKQ